MTTWLSRSRTKVRSTRGENWPLASCRLTTVREKTTPAVVIMAPATPERNHTAASGVIRRAAGSGQASARSHRFRSPTTSASPSPASTMSVGKKNRLSRKR